MALQKVLTIIHSKELLQLVTTSLQTNGKMNFILANNGVEAYYKTIQYLPDIVILDKDIPAMDGVIVINKILEYRELPIIVLVTEEKEKEYLRYLVEKPDYMVLIEKSHVEVQLTSFFLKNHRQQEMKVYQHKENKKQHTVIVIGTSTGGPRALHELLSKLPTHFKTPILIVQHMPKRFTSSLSKRLNNVTDLKVHEALDGEKIMPGNVYIAPGGKHMEIKVEKEELYIHLTKGILVHNHRPSVDILFRSLAEIDSVQKVAIILTGMGKDGKDGVVSLKKHDENTIIINQSEETSIVYGMPKAVKETGLVDYTVPLPQIATLLVDVMKKLGGK